MPVPTSMSDLSTTEGANGPVGSSESPSVLDNYQRALGAILRHTNFKGVDIASAATTNIGSATGEFVDITGTTTITSFGTISAGIERTVRFTSALTVTHNATSLILPNGLNITTYSGYCAVFRSLGSGNWILIADNKSIASTLQNQTFTAFTTGGTSSAYTGTPASAITTRTENQLFFVELHTDPTGSPTLAISGLATRNCRYIDATNTKQFITTTQVKAGNKYFVCDDGTDYVFLNILPNALVLNTTVDVRQAVQYGALTATGQPDLITQAQVGATIATGVTMAGTWMASVGNGFNTDGSQRNLNRVRTASLNVPSLNASATNYIWYDTVSDTAGFVTVADSFQAGGTIPVTNNQYTYDYLNHIMYLGNGTTATQSNRIIVAEVDTSPTVITAIRVRQYGSEFYGVFTNTLPAAATQISAKHNFGAVPRDYALEIECITTELNIPVGERIKIVSGNGGGTVGVTTVRANKSEVKAISSSAAFVFYVQNATTGVNAALTPANWKYRFTASRGF